MLPGLGHGLLDALVAPFLRTYLANGEQVPVDAADIPLQTRRLLLDHVIVFFSFTKFDIDFTWRVDFRSVHILSQFHARNLVLALLIPLMLAVSVALAVVFFSLSSQPTAQDRLAVLRAIIHCLVGGHEKGVAVGARVRFRLFE